MFAGFVFVRISFIACDETNTDELMKLKSRQILKAVMSSSVIYYIDYF